MKIEQKQWTTVDGWTACCGGLEGGTAELVLVFGATALLKEKSLLEEISGMYPEAHVCGCSTAGEICCTDVRDDSLVVTAIHFERTQVQPASISMKEVQDSREAGERLARLLPKEQLVHVFVLSDGLAVNGSDLVRGMTEHLPPSVTITGGLAGDGARFQETLVLSDGASVSDVITAVGFYGDGLKVGHGSFGGWDPFGPDRLITRSKGNVLFEMDGTSALVLYKEYLGEYADDLPAAGLLFPLSVREQGSEISYVRTLLAVDEDAGSLTFAGDVPQGATARLMKANFDRLIDGAVQASHAGLEMVGSVPPDLAILISCIGRKLVLKQRVEEEVEGVRDVLGGQCFLTGFYSYGEIAPALSGIPAGLHNQTMTITTLSEK